jgi:PhnB protein
MAQTVKPIPDGYHTVTPYLTVNDGAAAIAFYEKAFGAKETVRMDGPDGKIGHAEILIGDSHVMLADEQPERGTRSPRSIGGSPVTLALYVENVDALVAQAIAAGAKETRPVADQFYGDRVGMVEDPFGYSWHIGTHIEDVSPEEMKRRMAEAYAQPAAST